ncbi:hypothetical protein ASC75_02475 [Aminobacter sp. DSM 101952]|uniref:hypothetical protein n=1 Tax=Aminobacter sp. DSM 101952 TaxID=2735891 RepID=UPI0006F88539|nr:hypothetical protein [Aminobacter sp. DSM 101952]KQU76500.1 hypothetical protein ASC75_02475 [Aminobacter sp. DSM 101952]
MTAKSLQVEDLRLDLKNPRIVEATSQREALQKIITDQDIKLVALAESIVEDGLNPMDRFLVIPSEDDAGKFVVLEGNRRLAALKVLRNPSVLTGMQVRAPVQKRFEELARLFDSSSMSQVDCFEVEAREDGAMWINQRHTGENQGRGIVDWSGVASARFRGNDPALQALDFVATRGSLDADEKEKIAQRFPITTLDRLLSTPAVRSAIGVEITRGKLLTGLPFEEVMKPLQRMVRDLVSGTVTVTHLKRQPQMVSYTSGLGTDLPNLSTASSPLVPVEDLFPPAPATTGSSTGTSGATSSGGGTSSANGSGGGTTSGTGGTGTGGTPTGGTPKRRTPSRGSALIPKSCVLRVTNTKIAEVVKELRSLSVKTYPHAISVLFRVFLELSVDEYLKRHSINLTFTAPNGKVGDKKLRTKVDEAVKHMIAAGAPSKELTGITKALSDKHNPLHPDTLHVYVHNAFYSPTERELMVGWDNAQPFFERLWP